MRDNLQKVTERLRRKRSRKVSVDASVLSSLMLDLEAASRSAPHSSQALQGKIMAQHANLFSALPPSVKEGQETIAADLACGHARDIKQDAAQCGLGQLGHIEGSSRARGVWPGVTCQHDSVGIERLDRAFWALANCCVLAIDRKVFEAQVLRFSAPAAGCARCPQRSPLFCGFGIVQKGSSVVVVDVLES